MFETYDDVLTTDEACEALKVGHNTIYALLTTGKLKGFRCGRVWKIPKAAVKQYVTESSSIKP